MYLRNIRRVGLNAEFNGALDSHGKRELFRAVEELLEAGIERVGERFIAAGDGAGEIDQQFRHGACAVGDYAIGAFSEGSGGKAIVAIKKREGPLGFQGEELFKVRPVAA